MQKIEVLIALLHLHNIDFSELSSEEIRVWLHSLRNISRELEREIIQRDRDEKMEFEMSTFVGNTN